VDTHGDRGCDRRAVVELGLEYLERSLTGGYSNGRMRISTPVPSSNRASFPRSVL
jgi:hypothetical protein